jgi:hypothetical protein
LQIALQHQNIRGQIQHFQKEENAQATKAFRPTTDQLKTAKKGAKIWGKDETDPSDQDLTEQSTSSYTAVSSIQCKEKKTPVVHWQVPGPLH